jgi:hypothetical protein
VHGNVNTSYSWAQCRFCGRAGQDCPPAACLLCGTIQCFGNGSAQGTCSVCYHGYIPGGGRSYHDRCGKKRCDEPAASKAPRVGQVCVGHAATTKSGPAAGQSPSPTMPPNG